MTSSTIGRAAAISAVAALTLGFGSSFAGSANAEIEGGEAITGYERVDSILLLTPPHSWQVIDEDTVVVWATPFQPYLVELAFESPDLRFSQVIGITQLGSRVYAKFDAVKVGGFRYPIDSIYKMTREEARNLVRGT
jgi:hypothetical protein